MQIFVKLSGKNYVIDCKPGDLFDIIIIKAFEKFIKDNGKCIYSTLQINNHNYLRSSLYNFNGKHFIFGSNMTISENMNELTVRHSYLANPYRKFCIDEINYINELLRICKLESYSKI